jgi:hypothetical protein
MQFVLEHRFALDRDKYEQEVYFDAGLRARIDRAIKILSRQRLETEDNESIFRRVDLVKPERDLPSVARTILSGRSLEYIETATYYKGEHRIAWSISSKLLPEKFRGGGEVHLLENANHVIRRISGEVEISIFALGNMIEKMIINGIRESYNKAAEITSIWIAEHYEQDTNTKPTSP